MHGQPPFWLAVSPSAEAVPASICGGGTFPAFTLGSAVRLEQIQLGPSEHKHPTPPGPSVEDPDTATLVWCIVREEYGKEAPSSC